VIGLRLGMILSLGALAVSAQSLRDYEKRVTEFTLANRLHFIVMERHQVPVVSFQTMVFCRNYTGPQRSVRSGAPASNTWRFRGPRASGQQELARRKEDPGRRRGDLRSVSGRGCKRRSRLPARRSGKHLTAAIKDAQAFSDSGEFERILKENGVTGLASRTKADTMETTYSLPSNRLELWFLMESQRLAQPVMRDFYQRRSAAQSEYQTTVEGQPMAKLQQALMATAFSASPYRNPALGWPSEEANLRVNDAKGVSQLLRRSQQHRDRHCG